MQGHMEPRGTLLLVDDEPFILGGLVPAQSMIEVCHDQASRTAG